MDWRHDQEDREQPWHKEGRSEVGSRDCVTVLPEEDQTKREELQTTGMVRRSGIDEARSGKFYVVRRGRQTGIFTRWEDCRLQVEGYDRARFKSFLSLQEAEIFMSASTR